MERVYVKAARLINCQSFEDCVYTFSPGLNVITADNQTGKSVLFKLIMAMVSSVSYSRSEWKDLISNGNSKATFVIEFSDESVAVVIVTAQGPNYFYKETPSSEYIKSDNPFQVVRDKLGVVVDESGNILNIINQSNISRFTETTMTSPGIIKRIITHDELETLITNLNISLERADQSIQVLDGEIYKHSIVMQTNRYVNLVELEPIVESVGHALSVYEKLIEIERVLDSASTMLDSDKDYSALLAAVELYQQILTIEECACNFDIIDKLSDCKGLADLVHIMDNILDIQFLPESHQESIGGISSLLEVIGSILDVTLDDSEMVKDNLESVSHFMQFSDFLEAVTDTVNSHDALVEIEASIQDLRGQISLLGREVECPIYGRIQHDNGICVPLDNRSALSG